MTPKLSDVKLGHGSLKINDLMVYLTLNGGTNALLRTFAQLIGTVMYVVYIFMS